MNLWNIVHENLVLCLGGIEGCFWWDSLVSYLVDVFGQRWSDGERGVDLFLQMLDLVLGLYVLLVEAGLHLGLVNVGLFQPTDLVLFITVLIFQLLELTCGEHKLRIFFIDSQLQFGLFICKLLYFTFSWLFLLDQVS